MELRELRVTRLPGIDRSFTIAGEPGLNLVLGPNGSGKSSLCRAALGLLWPDPAETGRIVAATWADDGEVWLAERAGGPAVAWQRDGQASDPPALAPAHHAGVYRLGVLDLLKPAADATDRELAAEIRRQLAGGVDTGAVRRHFEWTGKEGQGPAQALEATRQRIRELLQQQRHLAEEEQRLDELRAQRREAVAAAGRRDALSAGHDLAAAMRALQSATDELAAFPPVMARLHGDENERLQRLTAARDKAAAEVAAADTARAEAEHDRDEAGLTDGGPDDAILATVREELADARELATELRGSEEDAAAAAAKVEATRDQLDGIEPQPGQRVPLEDAAAAVTGLRDRDRERAVRDGLDRLLGREDLGREGTAAGDPVALATARTALGDWLAAAAPAAPWPLRLLPWLAAAGLLVVGVALVPWRSGEWPGWVAAGLGVLLAPAWWLLQHRASSDRTRRQRAARAAFATTGLPEPSAWSRETIGSQLRGLLAQEAAAAQARLREQLRVSLQGERDQAAKKLGDDDAARELDQAQVLQRVAAWHAATVEQVAADKRREKLADRLGTRLALLRDRLAPWWSGDGEDVAVVAAAVGDLERRRERHRNAVKRLESATAQHAAAAERRDTAAAEITTLLAGLALDEGGAATTLLDLLSRLDDYREARRAVEHRTAQRDSFVRARDDLPADLAAIVSEALDLPAAELDAAIEEATARADRSEKLLQEITRIETRVDEARGDAQLAAARAAEEKQTAELAAMRDTVRGNALARLLFKRATEQYEAATEPPLLHRTRELFAHFTDGRYELSVIESDGDDPRFLARDVDTGRGQALAELSDGTRAQLLLAARLAALAEHERGPRPPLFLDESLTASDAVRFEAIGTAVLDLVRREGRQVFYLTCDPADVAAWQRLLAGAGEEAAPVIDLGKVSGLAAAAGPERLRPSVPAEVPEPTGDAAVYGEKIGAPPLAVGQDLDAVHLFHLLRDDLPLLAALLRRRTARYGQLVALADDLRADGTLNEAAQRRLEARGRAMTAFLDAFATGRGRPIPAGAIQHQSGIETSKLEEIEALASRLGGDAEHLLAALDAGEVKRLQQPKKEEVAAWLAAQGYLDRRAVLEREEVRRRTIRALRADISDGDVDWATLDRLLDSWWTAAGGSG